MANVADSTVENELRAGERLLWKGRPRSGIKLRGSDVFLIPFSLLWGGFAIFWEASVLTHVPGNTPIALLFPLFGVPFVLLGLYLIFGRFLVDAKRRERTEYALTNQRAIIATGVFGRKIRSIDYRLIPDTTITEKSDMSGTIAFGESAQPSWGMQRGPFPGMEPHPSAFEMIENVRNVYEIIQKAKSG